VSSCGAGTYLQGSQCFRSCPPTTYYYSLVCYNVCPTGLSTFDACVQNCPAGTNAVNGICQ
jgi:hypothetical protein